MKISLIRKINNDLPYWVKRPFTKIIRGKLINNSIFLETYRMLERNEKCSIDEIGSIQFEELKILLIRAYEHTEYYHNLFDQYQFNPYTINRIEEIQKLPVLTRDDIKKNLDKLCADDIPDFYTVSTGGTSGGAVDIYMSRDAIYKEWAFIYHYWSKFGYDYKKSKIATFRGVELGNKICQINPLYAEIRMNPFIMNRDNISTYNAEMEKFGATFIYGYPSSIYNYCRLVEEAGINVRGKYRAALIISENLYDFQKETISRVLDCSIAMFYGHSERAVFAERYNGFYKFNPFYGIVEISPEQEPVVTGFVNSKMPLIRYLLDDYVKEEEMKFKDSDFFMFADSQKNYSITGHKDSEVIYGKNGEYYVGVEALDFHGLLTTKFEGIQLAQTIPGELIIRYVDNGKITSDDLAKIKTKCKLRLGDGITLSFEPVSKIELTPRGKFRLLVQSIDAIPKENMKNKHNS